MSKNPKNSEKITRRHYAESLATQVYPTDTGLAALYSRLLDRELSRSYTANGTRKVTEDKTREP